MGCTIEVKSPQPSEALARTCNGKRETWLNCVLKVDSPKKNFYTITSIPVLPKNTLFSSLNASLAFKPSMANI